MSDVKTATVKMYNTSLKAGFLDFEVEEDDVILTAEEVGSLKLKNGDEVTFEVKKHGDKHYATNVRIK
ncbi:TPA: cold shock domain-containing protein [Pseudomonas putida]|uniref:cold shock domain-containing protein n=1 Tax=Pseudomonas TaxID=286 RepID=UPI001864F789|nr:MULTISPECIES: cold shock domain-containing protein [Pseudomonas]MDD1993472.1 cold shock domain-containing protein [Pseudomonas putida]HDS0916622.1 cold shock domain-containing protein [Pseudomonas putida]HDS0932257.1 cold shock domain-containing protein [Pseudomonas putida]HDS1781664.1 cold shock domain-containing protein [Pseudomonas putida]HDS3797260.1 cold shock domain-containing protein [Pseudomonas putida]